MGIDIIDKKINSLKEYLTYYGPFVFEISLFGFITYFVSITNQLTNNIDAFWHGLYYIPEAKEQLSEGRFMWWLCGKMFCGMQMDAYTTILAFIFFAIGLSIVHYLLKGKSKPDVFFLLFSFIFITEVGIRSQLSYRFQAPFFGLAFLLCIVGCWCIICIKNNIVSVILAVICFAVGMGFYQIDISCAALLLLMNLLFVLYKKDVKTFWQHGLRYGLSGGLGIALYMLIMKASMYASDVSISSRVGTNGLNIGLIIKDIPSNILRCYGIVYDYYWGDEWNTNIFQGNKLFYGVVFLFLSIGTIKILVDMIKNKQYGRALGFFMLVLLVPIFANCACFLGTDIAVSIQMTISIGFIIPVYGYMLVCAISPYKTMLGCLYTGAILLLSLVVVYGNFFSVQIDQQAMYEGKQAMVAMSNQMIDDLSDIGYFDKPINERKPIVVIGSASSNEQFVVSDVFYKANRYARMGDFLFDCVRVSWESSFRDYGHRNVRFVNLERYFRIFEMQEVKDLPMFPLDGYIQEMDEIIVLHVSNN